MESTNVIFLCSAIFCILCQKVELKYYTLSPRRINTDSVFIHSSHELDTYISIYVCGGEYFVLYNGYTDFKKKLVVPVLSPFFIFD
jgi:hypothetical protein